MGIPDEAFTPIEGDDKEICRRFKRVNREEREGQGRLFVATTEPWERLGDLAASMTRLDMAPDDSIEGIREKERMYEAMVRSGSYLDGRFWADSWCAAFVWKKTGDFTYPITEEVFRRIEHNPHACDEWMREEIARLSQQYQFFHWHLAFPDVFRIPIGTAAENEQTGWNGGFDVVLGNPPWERLQFEERAYFASLASEISLEGNQHRRRQLIRDLASSNPVLFHMWKDASREKAAETELIRNSQRFPLSAVDKFNTYAVFTELGLQLNHAGGSCGLIVKAGLITDKICAELFSASSRARRLKSVYEFENRKKLFAEVDTRERFALVSFAHNVRDAEFSFDNLDAESARDEGRIFRMSYEDIVLLSPNTGNCPKFPSPVELEIARSCYHRFPPMITKLPLSNPWNLSIDRYINVSDFSDEIVFWDDSMDSRATGFNAAWDYAPLFEGKLLHQYDHRFATYVGVTENSPTEEILNKNPTVQAAWTTIQIGKSQSGTSFR